MTDALLVFPEGPLPPGWPSAALVAALLVTAAVIAVIDARERIIPDICNGIVAGLGLAAAALAGLDVAIAAALHGIAAFALFWLFRAAYRRFRGHHGLGLGDVKFLGAAGTWTGLGGVPPMILIACAAAIAALAVARLRGRTVTAGLAIPFGPFLVVGLLGVLGARLI